MRRSLFFATVGLGLSLGTLPAASQSLGAASIEQVGTSRSSAALSVATERETPPVSAQTLAICQKAQAADRSAPPKLDCIKALQAAGVAAPQKAESAEGALLDMFGQNSDISSAAAGSGNVAGADQVSRQLSSSDFQGTVGTDAAASVARDRSTQQPTAPQPR